MRPGTTGLKHRDDQDDHDHQGDQDDASLAPAKQPVWMWVSACFAIVVGAGLRLWLQHTFPETNGDPAVYADLARNLLLHGQFALSDGAAIHATLIRLPGYPLFVALCFRLFGMENYAAVSYVQIVLELIGCLLLADLVRRICPVRVSPNAAALATLWLAVLCPFTALYAANPLTEGPTLFCIALALWSAARFQDAAAGRAGWGGWSIWISALLFTAAVSYAALLRPDGALIAVSLAPALLARSVIARLGAAQLTRIACVCVVLALTPFAFWTVRNWRVFHVFEPLAPRYASDPGDSSGLGFERWSKTWALDFVSTVQIYWPVPGGEIDMAQLPSRACDSPAECSETARLINEYNANGYHLEEPIDAGFGRLAVERIRAHPLRYYVLLPLGRVADMWLRPRTENLPIDLDWWVYSRHHPETRFSWAYVAWNLIYVILGVAGFWLKPRLWPWMLLYFVLRSALLSTVEGPEARYTLEFFPILFVLGGIAIGHMLARSSRKKPVSD